MNTAARSANTFAMWSGVEATMASSFMGARVLCGGQSGLGDFGIEPEEIAQAFLARPCADEAVALHRIQPAQSCGRGVDGDAAIAIFAESLGNQRCCDARHLSR